jgi:hypothetical protein
MYCPSDVNTGFIQLVGPIHQQDLNAITIKSYPLSISFAPRTTIPTLIGNRIDESTENTCTYRGQRFTLVDVQIVAPVNKGYILPGQTSEPVAELVISFSANTAANDLSGLSGILLCVPIYDSGSTNHADYLTQLIDPNSPTCDYTHLAGSEYTGSDYNTLTNSSLTSCIKACCDDTNCLAYTFANGTCHIKNSIPSINKLGDNNYISGTVNHNATNKSAAACSAKTTSNSNNKKLGTPNLETIFYSFNDDVSQSSLAYKTCFETIGSNNLPTSRSLYIVVFPNGITLTQEGFQQLLIQLNGNLPTYVVPPAIRGGDATLRSFKFDDEGNKVPTIISQEGSIYSTPVSTCNDEFKHRFEFFTLPPRLPISKNATLNSDSKSSYYKTTQYKCMPFNQLTDTEQINDGTYVIPGNKTLATILKEQSKAKTTENAGDITSPSISTEQIESLIAGIAGVGIAAIILLKVGSWISINS